MCLFTNGFKEHILSLLFNLESNILILRSVFHPVYVKRRTFIYHYKTESRYCRRFNLAYRCSQMLFPSFVLIQQVGYCFLVPFDCQSVVIRSVLSWTQTDLTVLLSTNNLSKVTEGIKLNMFPTSIVIFYCQSSSCSIRIDLHQHILLENQRCFDIDIQNCSDSVVFFAFHLISMLLLL